jgi:hypothetical protein
VSDVHTRLACQQGRAGSLDGVEQIFDGLPAVPSLRAFLGIGIEGGHEKLVGGDDPYPVARHEVVQDASR